MSRTMFETTLAAQYAELFTTEDYAMAAARYTPEALAAKITAGLALGNADKTGTGVRRTCKILDIRPTYTAIAAYINKGE